MDVGKFYNRLKEEIFVEYTTLNWKNGWEDEGNRNSRSLSIKNNIHGYNLFLLQKYDNYDKSKSIAIDGPNSFKIEIKKDSNDSEVRIDIEYKPDGRSDIDIYYFVDNEEDWLAQQSFLYELCKNVYDNNVRLRESINKVPNNLYGTRNPNFVKLFYRDEQLKKLGL
jgi:hypothetical protein